MMSQPAPKPPSFEVRKQALNKHLDSILSTQQQWQWCIGELDSVHDQCQFYEAGREMLYTLYTI